MASPMKATIPSCNIIEDFETFLDRALEDINKHLNRMENSRDNHLQCSISKTVECDCAQIKNKLKYFANQLDKVQTKFSEHAGVHKNAFCRDHRGRSKSKPSSASKKIDSGIGSMTIKDLPDADEEDDEVTLMKAEFADENKKSEIVQAAGLNDCPASTADTCDRAAAQAQDEAQTRLKCLRDILNNENDSGETCSNVASSSSSVNEYSLVDTSKDDSSVEGDTCDVPNDDSEPSDINVRL